jgi:hypothetical protein
LVHENVAAATLDDAFCEEIAVQSIVDFQSYRIAVYVAPSSCVDRRQIFSNGSTFTMRGARRSCARPLWSEMLDDVLAP